MYVVQDPTQVGFNQHNDGYRRLTLRRPYKASHFRCLSQTEGKKIRVLVVEDVEKLSALIVRALAKAGFQAEAAETAGTAEEKLLDGAYDAMILDLGLPDRDGLDLLRDLRRAGVTVPTLVLTAHVTLEDRISGLETGADDYLTKPFAFEELIARLRALLRRPGGLLSDRLEMGNVVFDALSREVKIAGRPARLTAKEQMLLEHLMRREGGIATKTFLEDNIYGPQGERAANALEVLVHRLRNRLAKYEASISITTVRGVGYMLGQTEAAARKR